MDTVPDLLILGVPIAAIAAGLVEEGKRMGLPVQWTGPASILCTLALLLLLGVSRGEAIVPAGVAGYVLAAIVYGLGASGLYSQVKMLSGGRG